MRWTTRLVISARSLFRRQRVEQQLDAELRFHLEQQVAENTAAGMNAADARAAARRSLGSIAYLKEECRSSLGLRLLDETVEDLRYEGPANGDPVGRPSAACAAAVVLMLDGTSCAR